MYIYVIYTIYTYIYVSTRMYTYIYVGLRLWGEGLRATLRCLSRRVLAAATLRVRSSHLSFAASCCSRI